MSDIHSTAHIKSKDSRNITTSISINPLVINVSLYKLYLMINEVDKLLYDLARNQRKATDVEIVDKQYIKIPKSIILHV